MKMPIQPGQRRSDSLRAAISKIALKQGGFRSRFSLRRALIPCCILFLTGLVGVFVGCGQAAPGKSLVGSWLSDTNGVIKFGEDGTLEAYYTNRTEVWDYKGTWAIQSNILIMTTLKTNGVPCLTNVEKFKIISADKTRLILWVDGLNRRTISYVRKN